MKALDKTKRQLLEEIRVLRSRNAKLERISCEMPGRGDAPLKPHLNQTRFQSLLQTAPSVILYLDREYRILEFNAEAEQIFGSRREDVLGKDYLELFLPEDAREAVAADIEKVLACEFTRGFEYAVITNDNQELILRWNVGPILDFGGKPVGIVMVGQDITGHKKTEEALKSERDFAGSLIETTQAIILLLDPEGRIRHFNSYMEQLSGYRLEEVKGKDWFTIFLPKRDRKRIRELFLRASGGIQTHSNVNPIVTKDGCEREIEWYDKILKDTNGDVVGLLSTGQDITERKQAEEELRISRDYLDRILNAMYEGVMVIDRDFSIKDVNNRFLKQYNCTRQEVVGHKCYEITHRSNRPCSGTEHTCPAKNVFDTTKPVRAEHIHSKQNGEEAIIEINSFPLFDKDGNVEFVVELLSDITDRKQAEEQARKRQAELFHISRLSSVGEMASGLAHELNQPLCAILTHTNVCLRTIKPEMTDIDRLVENLKTIESQTKLAGEIIRRIKYFVQKHQPHRTSVDINKIICEVTSFMESDIRHSETRLDLQLADQVSMVLADAVQTEQVLINLIRNAIESMENINTQERWLTIQTSMNANNTLEVAVRDTGKGLPSEAGEKLFESFFTTKTDGLGMGLAICRSIIEMHRGELWAKSNPDCGSTFTFTLPIAETKS